MKKVSILIPCYNSESFVAETIASCKQQTYPNVEVIVIDDGSQDKSYEIAKSFESDTIHVYKQCNAGACRARNLAFTKSTGDYIVYLDADDLINPEFVAKHVAILENTDGKSVSFCSWDRFRYSINEAKFPILSIYRDYEDAFQLLLDMWMEGSMLQTTCYMVPRKLIETSDGWDESVLKNQDGEFFSRILMLADKSLYVPGAKVYYRTGDYLTVSKASSKEKVNSMLDTFISYRKNSLAHEDSLRVRKALSTNFTLFMYIYGNQYIDLCDIARREIKDLGVGYQLNVEPPRVKQICKYISFDFFLWVRKIIFCR